MKNKPTREEEIHSNLKDKLHNVMSNPKMNDTREEITAEQYLDNHRDFGMIPYIKAKEAIRLSKIEALKEAIKEMELIRGFKVSERKAANFCIGILNSQITTLSNGK